MKKRLCLFMMLLLLLISAGCGQTAAQIPETPVTETSKTDIGSTIDSTTTVEPNEEDCPDTDAGKPDNVEPDSLPDSTSIDINDNDFNIGEGDSSALPEDGSYTSREDVALYIHLYGHLPPNFITKKEAEKLGWNGGSLEPFAPGMCIGGSHFGNYEGILPQKEGRSYTECDIDTLGADKRGAKRIVFSNDGLIYYTEDHYKSFELLYGEADS